MRIDFYIVSESKKISHEHALLMPTQFKFKNIKKKTSITLCSVFTTLRSELLLLGGLAQFSFSHDAQKTPYHDAELLYLGGLAQCSFSRDAQKTPYHVGSAVQRARRLERGLLQRRPQLNAKAQALREPLKTK